jgi:hypothetical protein
VNPRAGITQWEQYYARVVPVWIKSSLHAFDNRLGRTPC